MQVQRWTDFFQGDRPYHIYVVSSASCRTNTLRAFKASGIRFLVLLVDCINLGRLARAQPKSFIMVKLLDMPEATSEAALSPSPRATPSEYVAQPMIDVRDVTFAYGNHEVLHEVSLQMPPRAVTAFIGPSGCGKTTLLRCF